MATRDAWRTEAPELIRAELEKRLPSETKIIRHETDSFYHEGAEHHHVTMFYKGASPYADFHRIVAIKRDIYQMFWELDYDPIPAVFFQEEGANLV